MYLDSGTPKVQEITKLGQEIDFLEERLSVVVGFFVKQIKKREEKILSSNDNDEKLYLGNQIGNIERKLSNVEKFIKAQINLIELKILEIKSL